MSQLVPVRPFFRVLEAGLALVLLAAAVRIVARLFTAWPGLALGIPLMLLSLTVLGFAGLTGVHAFTGRLPDSVAGTDD